jgi:hypothetical protein
LLFEAVQGRVERSRFDLQRVTRGRPDHLRDAVPMSGSPSQGLEDDHVQGALEQLDPGKSALLRHTI